MATYQLHISTFKKNGPQTFDQYILILKKEKKMYFDRQHSDIIIPVLLLHIIPRDLQLVQLVD